MARVLYDLLAETSRLTPHKESFRVRQGGAGNNTVYRGRTFGEIKKLVDQLVAGFLEAGLRPGDRVALICDIHPDWLITDLAIITCGAVSVPRGTDVTDDDIRYILSHAECRFAVGQTPRVVERLLGLRADFARCEQFFSVEADAAGKIPSIYDLRKRGETALKKDPTVVQNAVAALDPEELSTLIYTSGTTGQPKGVMLSQAAWLRSLTRLKNRVDLAEGESMLSLLPPWHALERAVEYAVVMLGLDFCISSQKYLKDDIRDFKPTVFPSVPRIWEAVYKGIHARMEKEDPLKRRVFYFFVEVSSRFEKQKSILLGYDFQMDKPFALEDFARRFLAALEMLALSPLKLMADVVFQPVRDMLGGRLRVSVAGGSALPPAVDEFLRALGIKVVEGYGMTETAAIISLRELETPTPGTLGVPLENYKIRLRDLNGNLVEPGQAGARGTLWVLNDQLLKGYYKRPELNREVFDRDGYFNTGDIVELNWRGELIFRGRSKDTIALHGGENVEPVPVENALLTSDYIDQAMVVGHDQKYLAVLIVPAWETVRAREAGLPEDPAAWDKDDKARALFKKIILEKVNRQAGFKSFELVPGNHFCLLAAPFDPDLEMTRTMKLKRPVILENYAEQIRAIYGGQLI